MKNFLFEYSVNYNFESIIETKKYFLFRFNI